MDEPTPRSISEQGHGQQQPLQQQQPEPPSYASDFSDTPVSDVWGGQQALVERAAEP